MKLSYSFRVINFLFFIFTSLNKNPFIKYLVGKNNDEILNSNTCFYIAKVKKNSV